MNSSHEESLTLLRQQLARTPGGAPPEVLRAFEGLTPQQLDLALTLSAPGLNALTAAMRSGTIPPAALAQITSSATLLRRADQLLRPPQGTTARPADVLRDIFRLPPSALEQATIQAARPNVPSELLQQLIRTVPSDRLYLYERLSPGSMRELLSIDNATTRGLYEQALFANTISPNGLTEIRTLAGRSPEMGQLVEAILSRPRFRDMNYETTLRQLADARLDAPTLTALSRQITAGTVPLENLGALINSGSLRVAQIVRTIEQGGLDAVATQRLLALPQGQVDAVGRLLDDRTVTPEMLNRTLRLPDSHRQAMMEILTQEQSRPASSRSTQERLSQLIGDEAQAVREVQTRAARTAPTSSTTPQSELQSTVRNVTASIDRLLESRPAAANHGTSLTEVRDNIRALSEQISSSPASGPEMQRYTQTLQAIERALRADPNTHLGLVNQIVGHLAEGIRGSHENLGRAQMLTDLLSTPGGGRHFAALEQLSDNRVALVTTGGADRTVSYMGVDGWRVEPSTVNGRLTLVHDGNLRIPAGRLSEFPGWIETSRNADGSLNIRPETPIRVRPTVDDILLRSISDNAGGPDNCARAVAAYLRNVLAPGGAEAAVRNGAVIPPERLVNRNVNNAELLRLMNATGAELSNYTQTPPITSPSQITQPGLYVVTTGFDSSGNGHTFLVRVRAGQPPVVLDAALGTTRGGSAYSINSSGGVWRVDGQMEPRLLCHTRVWWFTSAIKFPHLRDFPVAF